MLSSYSNVGILSSLCFPTSSSSPSSSLSVATRSSTKVVLLRPLEKRSKRTSWTQRAASALSLSLSLLLSLSFAPSSKFQGAKMSVVILDTSLSFKKKAYEILDDLKGTSIFLVGMNCTMKKYVGKILADALRYYYFDSDSLVEEAAGGASAAKSFRETDEKGYCDSETEVLKQLSSMGRLVVCAGDGTVQTSTNLAYLRYGISIWINVPLDTIANEALTTESSLLKAAADSNSYSQVMEKLSQQYTKLKEGYATADASVSLQKVATELGYEDFASVTPEDMAVEALKEIEKLTRVKKMMEAAARPF